MPNKFDNQLFQRELRNQIEEQAKKSEPLLKSLLEEFLKVSILNDYTRDYYSFEEMMKWFTKQQDKYPNAQKGAAILQSKNSKKFVLILSLLNEDNTVFEHKGECIAVKITARKLDEEIFEHFEDTEVIIFE